MRVAPFVQLSQEQQVELGKVARSTSSSVRFAQRAKIIVRAAEGRQDIEIAQDLGITRQKAARWRARFIKLGIEGLRQDAFRPGRKKRIGTSKTKAVVRKTLEQRPANATHWSTRTMARATGLSEASVRRIWKAHGLKPHLLQTFKLSNDKRFVEKLEDVVGL